MSYSPWGRKESGTTEQLTHTHVLSPRMEFPSYTHIVGWIHVPMEL